MCPHQPWPQSWRLERPQRLPTPLLSKASQTRAAARPQQPLMGVPLALLPRRTQLQAHQIAQQLTEAVWQGLSRHNHSQSCCIQAPISRLS